MGEAHFIWLLWLRRIYNTFQWNQFLKATGECTQAYGTILFISLVNTSESTVYRRTVWAVLYKFYEGGMVYSAIQIHIYIFYISSRVAFFSLLIQSESPHTQRDLKRFIFPFVLISNSPENSIRLTEIFRISFGKFEFSFESIGWCDFFLYLCVLVCLCSCITGWSYVLMSICRVRQFIRS